MPGARPSAPSVPHPAALLASHSISLARPRFNAIQRTVQLETAACIIAGSAGRRRCGQIPAAAGEPGLAAGRHHPAAGMTQPASPLPLLPPPAPQRPGGRCNGARLRGGWDGELGRCAGVCAMSAALLWRSSEQVNRHRPARTAASQPPITQPPPKGSHRRRRYSCSKRCCTPASAAAMPQLLARLSSEKGEPEEASRAWKGAASLPCESLHYCFRWQPHTGSRLIQDAAARAAGCRASHVQWLPTPAAPATHRQAGRSRAPS